VKSLIASNRVLRAGRLAVAVVALLVWTLVCALEVSPQLHHFLHNDAQSPAHSCLLTQLQHHGVEPGCSPAFLASVPTEWNWVLAHEPFFVPASFEYRLSHSRAPPVA